MTLKMVRLYKKIHSNYHYMSVYHSHALIYFSPSLLLVLLLSFLSLSRHTTLFTYCSIVLLLLSLFLRWLWAELFLSKDIAVFLPFLVFDFVFNVQRRYHSSILRVIQNSMMVFIYLCRWRNEVLDIIIIILYFSFF